MYSMNTALRSSGGRRALIGGSEALRWYRHRDTCSGGVACLDSNNKVLQWGSSGLSLTKLLSGPSPAITSKVFGIIMPSILDGIVSDLGLMLCTSRS